MGPLGKGVTMMLTKQASGDFDVRSLGVTAIYSAVGIRDESMGDTLGRAMQVMPYPRLGTLTRTPHERGTSCWVHTDEFCIGRE